MTKDQQTNTAQTNRALPQGWREVRLGEVGEIVTGKTPPTKRSELFGSEYPFITPTDISDNIRFCEPRRFLSEVGKNYQKNLILPPNSICYTCIASIGKICLTKEYSFTNQQINSVIVNKEYYHLFIFYLLRFLTPDIKKIASGTTTGIINKTAFSNILISVPPLPTQKAIAKVLSAFDDKIELLREQNETLEQIGQTLFKEWFGKYSPLRPDDLPEGWRVGKLGEVIETFLGGTPSRSKKEYWTNGTVPWINSGKVNDFRITEGSEMITQEAIENSSTKLLPKGTVVLAITGATLGQYSRLEIDACFNQSVVGLKENEKFKSPYIYFWVANNISHIIKHASGGAHQHINKENINQTDFIMPTEEYLNEYYKIADVIMDKISNNVFQIQTLAQTRDTLLPKLMKGEVLI